MREDVRVKEERPNPDRRERCDYREANVKLRGTDDWRLARMLVTTRRNQRDRADVVTAIRVIVNVSVQLRRAADEKCPGKRRKQNSRNKNARVGL